MTTYGDYHYISCLLHKKLSDYHIENGLEIDGVYHRAKQLLTEMDQKAFHQRAYFDVATKWLLGGSTSELKEALYPLKWTHSGYYDFNAFALLDTCHLKL